MAVWLVLGVDQQPAVKEVKGAATTRSAAGDLSPISWGARWTPPTSASAIKCHQKSTSNSAGSSVGSLASPRATPRLGGVYVSCQYFPCSFVLALRELGLRLGVKAQLPAPRQLPWSPPRGYALAGYRTRISTCWLTKAAAS
jgi:hypothetical protein